MRLSLLLCIVSFFFFNDTATTEIYTLSLHDALPISGRLRPGVAAAGHGEGDAHHHHYSEQQSHRGERFLQRSEEHTSELQSRLHLVCRLLLEKKKKNTKTSEEKTNNDVQSKCIVGTP